MYFENRRSSLAVRILVPLCVLALITAPIPAPFSLIPAAHAQNQTWITQFGTNEGDEAHALAPDGAGGVMIAGVTGGSLGGPNAGRADAFLARYDSAGTQLWIRQFGAPGQDDISAMVPDGAGGVIVAGSTWGSLGGPSAGVADVFLAHYDSDGTQLWIRQFGTSARDYAYALAPDGAGGVMVAGGTKGSLGGPLAGRLDVFVAHYDSAGNQLWVRQFGTS